MVEYEGHRMVEYEGHWMVEHEKHWMLQDNLNKVFLNITVHIVLSSSITMTIPKTS